MCDKYIFDIYIYICVIYIRINVWVCEFGHELAATSASAQIAQATLVPFLAATGTVVVMIFWACSSFVAIQRTILGTHGPEMRQKSSNKSRFFNGTKYMLSENDGETSNTDGIITLSFFFHVFSYHLMAIIGGISHFQTHLMH